MANQADVRQIALRLPGVSEDPRGFAFSVPVMGKQKGFVWAWMERLAPKKPRVPSGSVVAVLVPNLSAKEAILAADSTKFFTDPHYDGFPAVVVRLQEIKAEELEDLLLEAWRCKASPELQSQLRH